MTHDKKVVIYLYNRFFDPLIQGNFFIFIEDYLKSDQERYKFHFITYEDRRVPLTSNQQKIIEKLKDKGINWTPLQWHPGIGIHNKLTDILAGFWTILKLRLQGYRYVIAYNSVAGSYCYLYGKILKIRLYLYTYEPHSEYSVDNKILSPHSLQYRILNMLERRSAHYASVVSSGTQFMQDRLEKKWKVKGKFFKLPSVTDCQKFRFDSNIRKKTRDNLGISPETHVFFYPGKFGSLYYNEEVALMFRWLLDKDSSLYFLVLTPQPANVIFELFNSANVPKETYTICKCDYSKIQDYFFAADFGVIAVRPGPSKQFISNIKVGEYLCAGLPFLITHGVSEDYIYAKEKRVGVVVNDFHEQDIKAAWPQIKEYLEMNPEKRRSHCRKVGLEYRGFESLNPVFKAAVSSLINS